MDLSAKTFFDLNGFAHHELFEEGTFVWDAIKNIMPYLESLDLGRIEGEVSDGVFFKNAGLVSIGEGTVVDPGVLIEGPVFIGKNCRIGHGAYVRPGSIIGDGCVVGHCSEVKHCIMIDGSAAPHINYVGDSILGRGVNMGSGARIANVRLDKGEIFVKFDGQHLSTGLKKFGAVLGDAVQLGCNCVINPGALLGKGYLLPGCETISGVNLSLETLADESTH